MTIDHEQIEAETEELRRDIAERQERRALGLEPEPWRVPESDALITKRAPDAAVRATDGTDAIVKAAVDAAVSGLQRQMWDALKNTVREIGRSVGDSDRLQRGLVTKLREEIPAIMKQHASGAMAEQVTLLRKEVADGKRNEVADVIRQKANIDEFRTEMGKELLRLEREVLALRRELQEQSK